MNDVRALIIFIRRPELGQVKTRLAKTIGDEKALLVYRELLRHTHSVARQAKCAKYLFYSGIPEDNDGWENGIFHKKPQISGDLGEKMCSAFETVFAQGHREVLIIGSDCYSLTPQLIEQAFTELGQHDVVIGPALDGGYYMLGMKRFLPDLFSLSSWGGEMVLTETVAIAERLGISYSLSQPLNDIDTEDDLGGSPDLLKLIL